MAQQLGVQYVRYYTDSSVARKIAPSVFRKAQSLPNIPKKKRRVVLHIDPIAIAGILMAGIMLILMTVGMVELNHAKTEAAEMEAYVQTLRQENETLQTTFDAGYDRSQVEHMAKALGMVPGEQAQRISIHVPVTQERENGFWENVTTFLSGLFA